MRNWLEEFQKHLPCNFEYEKISIELEVLAEEFIDYLDKNEGQGQLLNSVSDLVFSSFTECKYLHDRHPSNEILTHNMEVLIIASMVVKLGSMSKPLDPAG